MERYIRTAGECSVVFSALPAAESEGVFVRQPGGCALLAALALCQFGAPCAVSGTAYADALGRGLLRDAEKMGIDTAGITVLEGQTPVCLRDGCGRKNFYAALGPAPAARRQKALEAARDGILLFSGELLRGEQGHALWEQAARQAAEQNCLLALSLLGCDTVPDEAVLRRADLLCMDDGALAAQSAPYVPAERQAVLIFQTESVTLVTARGASATACPPEDLRRGEPAFGVAAALFLLFEAKCARGGLAELFQEEAFAAGLLKTAATAAAVPVDCIENLRGVLLHVAKGSRSLLAYAQQKMDEAAPAVQNSKWRPRYHIAAPSGWINDPNGLIQMDGVYHVFYQLHPYSPEWGPMYWGHATSRDLAHWRHEPIALAPDQPYESGCFSGSAVNDNGVLTLIYTAHNDGKHQWECQCVARSRDGGRTFEKSANNPVIPTYPPEACAEFRDPKVWRQDGRWQMVVGSGARKKGCALLYTSEDLEHWAYRGVMAKSDGTQGVMWECPNFCTVDGREVLIYSPLEMKGHKSVYHVGRFDCAKGKFSGGKCREMDHGLNYYAAQVFEDEAGRTLLIAWMDMWHVEMPTQEDGWAGALTVPRELHMRGDTLLQQPVPELAALREACLRRGGFVAKRGENPLRGLAGDCMELRMVFRRSTAGKGFALELRASESDSARALLLYDGEKHAFALPHGLSACKERALRELVPCETDREEIDIHILIDRSSIEAFIDEGALCFTQRIYPEEGNVLYNLSADGLEVTEFEAWRLGDAFGESAESTK